jgi:hypothetical protein
MFHGDDDARMAVKPASQIADLCCHGRVMHGSDVPGRILRPLTIVDGVVFLSAALMNFGLAIPLGFASLSFESPIWQAGVGEAVIGAVLVWAASTMRVRRLWTAYVLSALGIAFGLLSIRVVGLAREIHIVLVPLAVIGVALQTWRSARTGANV